MHQHYRKPAAQISNLILMLSHSNRHNKQAGVGLSNASLCDDISQDKQKDSWRRSYQLPVFPVILVFIGSLLSELCDFIG